MFLIKKPNTACKALLCQKPSESSFLLNSPHVAVDFSLSMRSVAASAPTVAPVMRTQCFALRRCFYGMHREAGQPPRAGPGRAGPDSAHIAFMWSAGGWFQLWGCSITELSLFPPSVSVSVSVQQQCICTCARWDISIPPEPEVGRSGRWRATVLIMGDVQSTQRESGQDAAAEGDSREVDNPQIAQDTEHEVGPSFQTLVFSKVIASCVTAVLRLMVLRAKSSINLKMKQRLLRKWFRRCKLFLNEKFVFSVSLLSECFS